MKFSDEQIEAAADKMIAGRRLTLAERRMLDSPQGDFAMAQVRAVLTPRRRDAICNWTGTTERCEFPNCECPVTGFIE